MIAALYSADGKFQRSIRVIDARPELFTLEHYSQDVGRPNQYPPELPQHSEHRYRLTGRVGENAIYREEA